MNIALVGDSLGEKTGGFIRFEELLIQWLLNNERGHKFFILLPRPEYREHFSNHSRAEWISWPKGIRNIFKKIFVLKKTVLKYNINCIHFMENITWLKMPGVKTITTVHDISPLMHMGKKWMSFLNYFFYSLNLNYTVKYADIITTDSQSSKKDILEYIKNGPDKIKMIYLSVNPPQNQFSPVKNLLETPFILMPCTFQRRKNIAMMILVFEKFKKKHRNDIKLVITGQNNVLNNEYYYEVIRLIHELECKDSIIVLKGVEEAELAWLYSKTLLTFYVTLYEAFGLPVIESLIHGSPVLAGNIGSCPEIGKNFALYCDPADLNKILENLEKIIIDKTVKLDQEKAKEFIKSNYKSDEMGSKYLQLYTS